MLSICSATEIGTAGLSDLRGTDPVMATQMIRGSGIDENGLFVALKVNVEMPRPF